MKKHRYFGLGILLLVVALSYAIVSSGQASVTCFTVKSASSLPNEIRKNLKVSPDATLMVSGLLEAGTLQLSISQKDAKISAQLRPDSFPYLYASIPLRAFREGSAQLTIETDDAQNGDLKFQVITPLPGYDDAMLYYNFQVYAKQGVGYEIYDSQQNFLTKAYATMTSTGQNLLYVAKDAPDLLCAIDPQGNEVWPPVFTTVYSYMLPPYCLDYVQIGNRVGVLDRDGKLIVPFGDIDIHRSKVLPNGNLQVEVGTFGLAGEALNKVPYPCLDEPGTYQFSPDGTLISHE